MAEYSGQTGLTKIITLPSSIEQVAWSKDRAAVGGIVHLEVHTLFIGSNSQIQIEICTASGTVLGKYAERMAGNRFRAPIRVSEGAKEGIYATVTLPRHGLRKRSPLLPVVPPVHISNVRWNRTQARPGDILTLTADVSGVPDGGETVIEIYEHDSEGAHEPVSRFPGQVKNRMVEAEWQLAVPADAGSSPPAGMTDRPDRAASIFFRITVAGLAADSGLLDLHK